MQSDTTHYPPTFGRWLKRLRGHHDLTQEQLAERAYCSVQAIRAFETGKRRPSVEMAERLAEVLQIPADQQGEFVRLARRATVEPPDAEVPVAPPIAPQATVPAVQASHLPNLPTPLIGRQAERAVLHQLFGEGRRLVSLVGPGGMGKTHLAIQVAHDLAERFAGGAFFAPLASISSSLQVPGAIAAALGVPLPGGEEATAQLDALLAGRTTLLVLDNFEHLLSNTEADAAIGWVEHLLHYLPGVSLLITSRERLRIPGEHSFELTGLSVPRAGDLAAATQSDAVMLFLACAQRADRTFSLTPDNEAAVVQVCTLLEGAPLGIELAAAWVRTLTVDEIAAEVVRNIDLLTTNVRGLPARHRSLRAVFEHSWGLLTPDERTTLARLSILRGGFDRAAAGAVGGATLPMLADLIDKSLIRTVQHEGAPVRYDIHELLRQYLGEKLAAAGDEEAVRQRHATYFVELAERLAPQLYAPDSHTWQRQLESEQANLSAALEWTLCEGGRREEGLRLASALGRFWYLAGRWREGRHWLGLARTQPLDGGAARARLLVTLGELQVLLGEQSQAQESLEEGLARWRALAEPANIAWALFQLGNLLAARGEYDQAESHFQESLSLYRELGDGWGTATVLNQLGSLAINRGDYRQATIWLDESLPILRSLKRQGGVSVALNVLGRSLLGEGEVERASELFQEALAMAQQRQSQAATAWAHINLGLAHIAANRHHEAAHQFRAALSIYKELDSVSGLIAVFNGLAAVAGAQQHPAKAAELLAVAARLREQSGQALTLYEAELAQRTLDAGQRALGEEAWEAAWTAGRYLSLPAAIELASWL
jgi:predicted ATPase/transcriptional regulator with XRE-family HTH domain